MKNHLKNKLALTTQTIRQLDAEKLAVAVGGYYRASVDQGPSCPRAHSCTLICLQ